MPDAQLVLIEPNEDAIACCPMRILDDVAAIRHIPLMVDDDSVTFFKALYSLSRPRIPQLSCRLTLVFERDGSASG